MNYICFFMSIKISMLFLLYPTTSSRCSADPHRFQYAFTSSRCSIASCHIVLKFVSSKLLGPGWPCVEFKRLINFACPHPFIHGSILKHTPQTFDLCLSGAHWLETVASSWAIRPQRYAALARWPWTAEDGRCPTLVQIRSPRTWQ